MAGSIALLIQIGVVLLVVAVVVLAIAHIQLVKKLRRFMIGRDGASLEESLEALLQKTKEIETILQSHREGLEVLDGRMQHTIRAYSLVRYNAFANDGGAQSFASGLLDEHGNGYVLSVISGRSHVGVYARPIVNGKPESTLTDEEQRALTEANLQLK